jgi:hypothetical protein
MIYTFKAQLHSQLKKYIYTQMALSPQILNQMVLKWGVAGSLKLTKIYNSSVP